MEFDNSSKGWRVCAELSFDFLSLFLVLSRSSFLHEGKNLPKISLNSINLFFLKYLPRDEGKHTVKCGFSSCL